MYPKQTISQKKCLMKKEDIRTTTTTTTQQNVEAKKNKEKLRERERERKERQQQPKRAKQKQRLPNNTKHNFCTLKSIPTTLFFFFLLPPVFFCPLPLAGAIAQKQVSSLSLTLTPQLRPALLSSLELTGKVF
jgi:hypothetical protein